MMYDVVQLKMSNGSELVCEVMDWPDDITNQMIVRNALSIVNVELDDNERIYMFVPWIHFNEGEKDYIIINCDHIIATGKPNTYLYDQFKVAVHETNQANKKREEEHKKKKEQGLKELEGAIDRILNKEEKPQTNVLSFPKKDDDIIH